MRIEYLFGTLFLLFIFQAFMAHREAKCYRKAIHHLHSLGNVGIGSYKPRLGAGTIMLIACDNTGKILEVQRIHGITIFSRLQTEEKYIGRNIHDWFIEIQNMDKKERVHHIAEERALTALLEKLNITIS